MNSKCIENCHAAPRRYNVTSDTWEDLSQKLEVGRAYATAIPIPGPPHSCLLLLRNIIFSPTDDMAGCDYKGANGDDDKGPAAMEDAYAEYLSQRK